MLQFSGALLYTIEGLSLQIFLINQRILQVSFDHPDYDKLKVGQKRLQKVKMKMTAMQYATKNYLMLLSWLHLTSYVLKRFDFCTILVQPSWWLLCDFFFVIWCIAGCCFPSNGILVEKYEIKIMRREKFIDPTLCFVYTLI
jgi:hypothetical protein